MKYGVSKLKVESKKYNVSKTLPNVLLIGNGVLQSLAEINGIKTRNWSESLIKLSDEPMTEAQKEKLKGIPYSVKATIVASAKDTNRNKKYEEVFKTLKVKDYSLLNDLVSIGFDSILTTNYTYEIENCFLHKFSDIKVKDKKKYACQIKRKSLKGKTDPKYLIHTYNQVNESPPVWHIHGEERRKSSIVLTHDEYARLLQKLLEENKVNKNKYVEYENEVKYKSWLDYFLMSNLYIVGLGMDFSEFDLWWILNRRMRENQKSGKITYFKTIYDDNNIVNALSHLNINVQEIDVAEAYDITSYYIKFYKQVTEYIKKNIEFSKGVLRNEKAN